MKMHHVDGKDRGQVLLYALSTCVWCRKTKRLLDSLGVAYDYTNVDLLDETEKEQAKENIRKWNPRCSFPTIVVNDNACIVGYDEDEIKEVLGDGK